MKSTYLELQVSFEIKRVLLNGVISLLPRSGSFPSESWRQMEKEMQLKTHSFFFAKQVQQVFALSQKPVAPVRPDFFFKKIIIV